MLQDIHLSINVSLFSDIEPEEKPVSEDFSDCQITDTSIGVSSEGSIVFHQQALDSSTLSSGIVALYHRGEWGNICYRSSFTITEADVICHQMMYTGASSFTSGTSTHELVLGSNMNIWIFCMNILLIKCEKNACCIYMYAAPYCMI